MRVVYSVVSFDGIPFFVQGRHVGVIQDYGAWASKNFQLFYWIGRIGGKP